MSLGKSKSKGFHLSLTMLITLLALVAIALASWKPIAIVYHRYCLDHAGHPSDPFSAAYSRASHIDRLAQLGFYEERIFVYQYPAMGSPEYRALKSDIADFASKYNPVALQIEKGSLIVWETPERMSCVAPIIDTFIDAHHNRLSDAAN
jgi:hypothetical protein